MPLMKIIILLFSISFSVHAIAEDNPQGKYQGYVFGPVHGGEVPESLRGIHQDNYEQYLLEFQAPRNLLDLEVESDRALLIRVRLTNSYEFMKRSDEVYKKTGHRELSTWDGVLVYNDHFNKMLLKERELLPVGRGGYDYYGCIDEKPLFKANIIGDMEKEELFVVTGAGHHTDNMRGNGARDHLMLHVYGGAQYDKLLEVMLLAVNYRPWNPDNPPKDYYFPRSGFSQKKVKIEGEQGEGRKFYSKLFFQDFDENDRMDIIIWQVEYKSRKIETDNKPGFDLVKSEFIRYEENAQGDGLTQQPTSTEQMKTWLLDNNLAWSDGWPNQSLCTGGKAKLPMMIGIDDPTVN